MDKDKDLLRRKIDTFLIEWKSNPEHMPLIVKGARQIGKTECNVMGTISTDSTVVSLGFSMALFCFGTMIKG